MMAIWYEWPRADQLALLGIVVGALAIIVAVGFGVYAIRDARSETRKARDEARAARSDRDKAISAAKVGIEAAISAMIMAIPDMRPLGEEKVKAMEDCLMKAQRGQKAIEDF